MPKNSPLPPGMSVALLLLGLLLASAPTFTGTAFAGEVLVDVLDVGQGDAVLIRGGGKAVLIDAGPRNGKVADQLRSIGVQQLDLVVATHPHADHIGGMLDVVQGFDIGLYMDNGMPHSTRMYDTLMTEVEARGLRYRTARQGLKLNLGDEASFTVLFPADALLRNTRSDINSNSVVLWLDHGDVSMLFTGDSEAPTEEALLPRLQPVDVLKVAHHGSNHSSTTAMLAQLQPRYALISCGVDNRYGHPGADTLARLAEVGAMVYRTDQSGNLRVVSDGITVEVLEGDLVALERMRSAPPAPRGVVGYPDAVRLAQPDLAVVTLSKRELRRIARQERRETRQAR